MAAPITHIVMAEKVLKNLPNISRKEFFIGTSFPDIRYIRVIDRDATHVQDVASEDIQTDSFRAGFLFHSRLDTLQVEYHRAHPHQMVPEDGLMLQAFKLFEDQVLWEKLSDWDTIANYFNDILSEEIEFKVEKENIAKWHSILREYMSQKPTPESRAPFFKELFFTPEQSAKIEVHIKEMEADQTLTAVIEDFYQEIQK